MSLLKLLFILNIGFTTALCSQSIYVCDNSRDGIDCTSKPSGTIIKKSLASAMHHACQNSADRIFLNGGYVFDDKYMHKVEEDFFGGDCTKENGEPVLFEYTSIESYPEGSIAHIASSGSFETKKILAVNGSLFRNILFWDIHIHNTKSGAYGVKFDNCILDNSNIVLYGTIPENPLEITNSQVYNNYSHLSQNLDLLNIGQSLGMLDILESKFYFSDDNKLQEDNVWGSVEIHAFLSEFSDFSTLFSLLPYNDADWTGNKYSSSMGHYSFDYCEFTNGNTVVELDWLKSNFDNKYISVDFMSNKLNNIDQVFHFYRGVPETHFLAENQHLSLKFLLQ